MTIFHKILCVVLFISATASFAQDDTAAVPPTAEGVVPAQDAPSEPKAAPAKKDPNSESTAKPAPESKPKRTTRQAALAPASGNTMLDNDPADPNVSGIRDLSRSIGSSGAFSYAVPLTVPAFRGLEPKLSLSYSSLDKSIGGSGPVIGTGWSLQGTSAIVRTAETGGVPSYRDAQDMYSLDGEPLLACVDAAATQPLARSYPARFKSANLSASCASGGQFVTLRDNYLRIELVAVTYGGIRVDNFIVTDKSGVRYTYKPLGQLAGFVPVAGSPDLAIAFERKFLLAEIRDLQTSPNIVSLDYDFGPITDGLAERIAAITYAGYAVNFNYFESSTYPRYAIGHATILGGQRHVLKSITMLDGANQIRAYELVHEPAETTGQRKLKSVQEFGKNFVLTGAEITSGTGLPAYVFSHTGDALSFTTQSFAGRRFHAVSAATDLADDGRTDALMMASNLGTMWSVPKGAFTFSSSRALSVASYPLPNLDTVSDSGSHSTLEYQSHWTSGYGGFENVTRWVCQNVYHPPMFGQAGYTSFDCGYVTTQEYVSHPPELVWDWVTVWHNHYSAAIKSLLTMMPQGVNGAGAYFLTMTHHVSDSSDWAWTKTNAVQLQLLATEGTGTPVKATLTANIGTNSGSCQYGTYFGASPILVGQFDRDRAPEVVFGATVYNVAGNTLPADSALTPGISTYCSKAIDGAAAIDLDGDGVDEILAGNTYYRVENGAFVARALTNTPFTSSPVNEDGDEVRVVRFGDVNGDGAVDGVVHQRGGAIIVYISTGQGFLTPDAWASEGTVDSFGLRATDFGSSRTQLADMNGDGLDDLILHNGHSAGSRMAEVPDNSESARIFISTGRGFSLLGGTTPVVIANFLGAGDFDGDGQTDLMTEGTDGGIRWNASGPRSLIETVTTPLKGTATVHYAGTGNSSYVSDDAIPGVQQVVRALDVSDGVGQTQVTTFTYDDGRFDYALRQSMGYRTTIATLPELSNETEAPTLTTTYWNDHVGRAGRMAQKQYSQGGTGYQQDQAFWTTNLAGNGPYRADLQRENSKTLNGTIVLRRSKTYLTNEFGERTTEIDLGVTNVAGDDVRADDNTITQTQYAPNRENYVVNRPYAVWKGAGEAISGSSFENWLWSEYYYYDEITPGSVASNKPPVKGNLSSKLVWTGNRTALGLRRVEFNQYDAKGNILSTADALGLARGYETTFTYDSEKQLFKVSETNPAGHVTASTWNTGCQTEASKTDPNGLVTTMTQDVLCRHSITRYPDENYEQTIYVMGDPVAQYTETRSPSASRDPASLVKRSREYMDGLGRVWKKAQSGATSDDVDLVWSATGYDVRNNVIWTTKPLTLAEAAGAPAAGGVAGLTTRVTYDPLGRELVVTLPGGAKSETAYTATGIAGVYLYSAVVREDPHCFDTDIVGTLVTTCGKSRAAFDVRGNKIQDVVYQPRLNADGTVTEFTTVTNYEFDLMDRLTKITGPEGNVWAFEYDSYGNRTMQDDPALGIWRMAYDVNNNLYLQTDAKNQTIRLWYDDLNRVVEKRVTSADGTINRALNTYDQVRLNAYNIGQLTQAVLGNHLVEYDYGANGKIAREWHTIDGNRRYAMSIQYRDDGSVSRSHLPDTPGSTSGTWLAMFDYDAASRMTDFGTLIPSMTYDLAGNLTGATYGNGLNEVRTYNRGRGWLNGIRHRTAAGATIDAFTYNRSATGRVASMVQAATGGTFTYDYDYAGRLIKVTDSSPSTNNLSIGASTYTYDRAGRMTNNSAVGSYDYMGSPVAFAPISAGSHVLDYDANGNMIRGFGGKVMTYDGDNRPLSVRYAGKETRYVYGADGKRLKKIEKDLATGVESTTVYFGPVEIRDYGVVGTESVLTYPLPGVRLRNGVPSYLMADQLGSVRVVSNDTAQIERQTAYTPFGKPKEWLRMIGAPKEAKSFIGERYDSDAGLMFLNARYYDPDLAIFIQPDWFEVTKAGVGLNRYAYSGSDPINGMDPGGNLCSSPGPYAPIIACNGSFWHDIGASTVNLLSDFNNIVTSPIVALGYLTAPYEGPITNLAITTPIPHDDALAAIVRGSGSMAASAAARLAPTSRITGSFQAVNESMSTAARNYQSFATGAPSGTAFIQNGVKFDGVDLATGTLLDAKFGMDFMINKVGGGFKPWSRLPDSAIAQAFRQIGAANGAPIEWRFSSANVANAFSDLFASQKIDINVVHYIGK